VEFVAVLAGLFQKGRVSPKLEVGETSVDAVKRAKDVVADSVLTSSYHMAHPERVRLVLKAM
jgi:hypothetical protein